VTACEETNAGFSGLDEKGSGAGRCILPQCLARGILRQREDIPQNGRMAVPEISVNTAQDIFAPLSCKPALTSQRRFTRML